MSFWHWTMIVRPLWKSPLSKIWCRVSCREWRSRLLSASIINIAKTIQHNMCHLYLSVLNCCENNITPLLSSLRVREITAIWRAPLIWRWISTRNWRTYWKLKNISINWCWFLSGKCPIIISRKIKRENLSTLNGLRTNAIILLQRIHNYLSRKRTCQLYEMWPGLTLNLTADAFLQGLLFHQVQPTISALSVPGHCLTVITL